MPCAFPHACRAAVPLGEKLAGLLLAAALSVGLAVPAHASESYSRNQSVAQNDSDDFWEIRIPKITWPDLDLPDFDLPDMGLYENELGLAPAPLPRYRVGQRFTFSDGSTQTVAAVEPGRVTWRDHKGRRSKRALSFVEHWATARNMRIVEGTGALWPLDVGRFDRLRVQRVGKATDGGKTRKRIQEHACLVMGSERITVAAGTFDSFRVECKRYSRKRIAERRIWHYAPAINHYVRFERITRKGGRREYRELVAKSG